MAIRLWRAKAFLTHGMPAAEVAIAVGLTDQSHLTRTFTQRYGITPVRYQKQVRLVGEADGYRHFGGGHAVGEKCFGAPQADGHQSHLTRTFTQRYGITPVRYQKQVARR
jgi:AraC-like DNA-binding protein